MKTTTLPKSRLDFILSKKSQNWLASELGVSQSSISNYSTGKSNIPAKLYNDIRNAYQRNVYSSFRDLGASSVQARRYSWYSPDAVTDLQTDLRQWINDLIEYGIYNKEMTIGRSLTAKEYEDYVSQVQDGIIANIQKSKKPLEDIPQS